MSILANNCHLNVYFIWVKGHTDIKGNIYVDKIVNGVDPTKHQLIKSPPLTDCIVRIKSIYHDKWVEEWKKFGQITNTHYYQIQNKIPTKPWFKNSSLSRSTITTINRLRFNHGKFPAHLYKIKITENPNCSCGEYGDINHILFNCPLYIPQSKVLYDFLIRKQVPAPYNIQFLLMLNNVELFNEISNFF